MRRRRLIRAAQVVDAAGVDARPGVLLLDRRRIVAAGAPEAVGAVDADVEVVDLPGSVVMPGLVNTHVHLDLSAMGPLPFDGDFPAWLARVRDDRPANDAAITSSVRLGVDLARAGGTVAVGDIAGVGSLAAITALGAMGLRGVAFLEVFGLGRRQAAAIEAMRQAVRLFPDAGDLRLGLQPHAPYSCGPEVYTAAAALGRPLATHLAESPEEIEFVAAATGPLAEMIRDFGLWDEAITATGAHPVDHVLDLTGEAPLLAAHVNHVGPAQIERLAAAAVTVAYCPRASAYFGHADHPYRALRAAGVPVALGTDSIVNLDTPDRISVLDEMRLLHRRDGVDPGDLLAMATLVGAAALGVDPDLVTLAPGATAGIIAVDAPEGTGTPLARALAADAAPQWVVES